MNFHVYNLHTEFPIRFLLQLHIHISVTALDNLGFGQYKEDAVAVMEEAKAVAAKKRKGSSRLENLGIPEEELLRQQQELFAKVSNILSKSINPFTPTKLYGMF